MDKEKARQAEEMIDALIVAEANKSKEILKIIAEAKTSYKKSFYKKKLKKANKNLAGVLLRAQRLKTKIAESTENDEPEETEANKEMG